MKDNLQADVNANTSCDKDVLPAAGGDWREWVCLVAPAVGLWMAFPPVAWWPLAWLAPVGWIRLATQANWRMPRPYRRLYLVGLLHWTLMVQWIRLPHWSAYFGWALLAIYLAVYVPLFVGMTRSLIHRLRLPGWLAAPISWTGLELARGYLLTGFSMSLLAHSQVKLVPLLQIADLVGAYGVSFLVILLAGCIEALLPRADRRLLTKGKLVPLAVGLVALAGCWTYGNSRIRTLTPSDATSDPAKNQVSGGRVLHAALIQGALDTQFDGDEKRVIEAFFDYMQLSRDAVQAQPVDLLIWPESMFSAGQTMVTYQPPVSGLPGWDGTPAELRERLDEIRAVVESRMVWTAEQVDVPLIVGMGWDHCVAGDMQRYNSAVFLSAEGKVLGRYDKMHPVMFGEYVPFGRWLPWLYHLTPMSDGLAVGTQPQIFTVRDVRLSPTICFENTVSHLMRRQLKQLMAQDKNPDVLVTITNDGWFWGSSLLDVHLACGVFRAIELRRPVLIAANTGFSAAIATSGHVLKQGPRRARAVVAAPVVLPPLPAFSAYLRWGDWFAGACLAIGALSCFAGARARTN